MLKKLKKYREGILYLVFGGLTTLINYAIFFPLNTFMPAAFANIIAWVGAVIFAFVTNKLWVFRSTHKGEALWREALLFFAARIASLVMETAIMWAFIDTWQPIKSPISILDQPLNDIIVKTAAQIAVIVANYFLSKQIIFKKKENDD